GPRRLAQLPAPCSRPGIVQEFAPIRCKSVTAWAPLSLGLEKGPRLRNRSSPCSLRARAFGRPPRLSQGWIPNHQPPTIFSSLFSLILTSHSRATPSHHFRAMLVPRKNPYLAMRGLTGVGKITKLRAEKSARQ